MYVVNCKGDCMTSNNVPIQHLRSEQEEADTRMLLHGLDATKRGETSTFIQSQDTDVLVLMLWTYKDIAWILHWLQRQKEKEEVLH